MATLRDLCSELLASLDRGQPVCYCRLVETRGSTPQKPGAAMLVYADGSQAGTLGGGCVEAEVKRQAIAILNSGPAKVVTFQLDSDYGWDDGLICGGRMRILIEPLRDPAEAGYFRAMLSRLEAGIGLMEAIVYDAETSGLPTPAAYLFDEQSRLVASNPLGESIPALVEENLPGLADRPRASAKRGIAYLPQLQRCRLVIVGGGHVGQAVADWAPDLGFDVWVVDDRADCVSAERFPRAERRICGEFKSILGDIEITCDTYCLIVTRGHNHDEEALYHLIDRGARYVGMIGSKRKIRLIFEDLLEHGISPELLARVHAPVGIDIGSQTVPEIAVSILAELVAHRNLSGEVPGRPNPVTLAEPN